ncbi:hypothetical protein IE81DRAFT_36014 [Ceraceosorus guamensis]|uniref:histidine kinase n=1 Tax=Ceraceosorus guamensis TaxID=1522189 RepID=A0A316W377_9BASI|nr:hypothetical protein IE81DRAFT_36014 [Ceraceosorus guamensis]PWN44149.1 hypothetical protein IE81DRAFT_36014 [Ceraceosorus guamensis]
MDSDGSGRQSNPHTPKEGVDKALIELIQTVQHELRTPLHGMLALIESIRADVEASASPVPDTSSASLLGPKFDSVTTLHRRVVGILDDFADFATETMAARTSEILCLAQADEPVDLGQLLDDVATDMWNAQVNEIRTEQGVDARLPPPPELILQIDTNLRGWKSLVSPSALKRVCAKLISNGLRFTRRDGFVEVSLSSYPAEGPDGQKFIQISVEDNGDGMTEESLFQPFAKADVFKSGAGLSMALCSSIVRRLGGSMQVSSDKGRGTVIAVIIPVEDLPLPMANRGLSSSPSQLVYLHGFEGVGLTRLAGAISGQLATFGNLYTSTQLEECDYLLLPEEVCYDTEGGIDAILSHAKPGVRIGVLQAHESAGIEFACLKKSGILPTFVTRKPFGPSSFSRLLDLVESKPNLELARAVRSISQDHIRAHGEGRLSNEDLGRRQAALERSISEIAAPTATTLVSDQGESSRPAINTSSTISRTKDLIFSPETVDEVLRAPVPVPAMLAPRAAPGDSKSIASTSPNDTGVARSDRGSILSTSTAQPFMCLVAEDNPLNLRILTQMLRQAHIRFCTAADGMEAVEQFREHAPAVTLLDINMPRMDGWEAAKKMRDMEANDPDLRLHKRRIVAVTALGDEYSKQRGLEECGMDAWYTKPLKMKELKADLQLWMQQWKAGSPGEIVSAPPYAENVESAPEGR